MNDHRISRRSFLAAVGIAGAAAALTACGVNDMNKQAAAFNMAKKLVTETNTVACTLDKSGDIRHNEGIALAHRNNTEHGRESSEMIVGNNGLSLADNRNKR